jgi:hypothetical protein
MMCVWVDEGEDGNEAKIKSEMRLQVSYLSSAKHDSGRERTAVAALHGNRAGLARDTMSRQRSVVYWRCLPLSQ